EPLVHLDHGFDRRLVVVFVQDRGVVEMPFDPAADDLLDDVEIDDTAEFVEALRGQRKLGGVAVAVIGLAHALVAGNAVHRVPFETLHDVDCALTRLRHSFRLNPASLFTISCTRSKKFSSPCRARASTPAARRFSAVSRAAIYGPAARKTVRTRSVSSAIPISSAPMAPKAESIKTPSRSPMRSRKNGGRGTSGASRYLLAANLCCRSMPNCSPRCMSAASRSPSKPTGRSIRRKALTGFA